MSQLWRQCFVRLPSLPFLRREHAETAAYLQTKKGKENFDLVLQELMKTNLEI